MARANSGRYHARMTKRQITKIEKLMAVMKANMERANRLYRELEGNVALMKRESRRPKAKQVGAQRFRKVNRA